ncbi:MAG: hypothetical protein RJA22_1901 [Verrucomicrobiota bacterium]
MLRSVPPRRPWKPAQAGKQESRGHPLRPSGRFAPRHSGGPPDRSRKCRRAQAAWRAPFSSAHATSLHSPPEGGGRRRSQEGETHPEPRGTARQGMGFCMKGGHHLRLREPPCSGAPAAPGRKCPADRKEMPLDGDGRRGCRRGGVLGQAMPPPRRTFLPQHGLGRVVLRDIPLPTGAACRVGPSPTPASQQKRHDGTASTGRSIVPSTRRPIRPARESHPQPSRGSSLRETRPKQRAQHPARAPGARELNFTKKRQGM